MFRVTEQIAIKHRHARKPNEIKNARPCPKKTVSGTSTFFNEKYCFRILFQLNVFGVPFCKTFPIAIILYAGKDAKHSTTIARIEFNSKHIRIKNRYIGKCFKIFVLNISTNYYPYISSTY